MSLPRATRCHPCRDGDAFCLVWIDLTVSCYLVRDASSDSSFRRFVKLEMMGLPDHLIL